MLRAYILRDISGMEELLIWRVVYFSILNAANLLLLWLATIFDAVLKTILLQALLPLLFLMRR